MRILEDGRINCRVRIEGAYNGEFFVYTDPEGSESQFIWPDGNPSKFWWEEGNMACDCNRWGYLPPHLQELHSGDCGHEITLYKIIPIEGDNLPTLELEN